MSRKATACGEEQTVWAGICPVTILQKIQSDMGLGDATERSHGLQSVGFVCGGSRG